MERLGIKFFFLLAFLSFPGYASQQDCQGEDAKFEYCWYRSHNSTGALSNAAFVECDKKIKDTPITINNGSVVIHRSDFSEVEACTKSKLNASKIRLDSKVHQLQCLKNVKNLYESFTSLSSSLSIESLQSIRQVSHNLLIKELESFVAKYRSVDLSEKMIATMRADERSILDRYYTVQAQDYLAVKVLNQKMDALLKIDDSYSDLFSDRAKLQCSDHISNPDVTAFKANITDLRNRYRISSSAIVKMTSATAATISKVLSHMEKYLVIKKNEQNLQSAHELTMEFDALFATEEQLPKIIDFYDEATKYLDFYRNHYAPYHALNYFNEMSAKIPRVENGMKWQSLPEATKRQFLGLIQSKREAFLSYDTTLRGMISRQNLYTKERIRQATGWLAGHKELLNDCFKIASDLSLTAPADAATMAHENDYLLFVGKCMSQGGKQ